MNTMIWRSDDIQKNTDLKLFKQVHGLFIKYKILHTITLICKDFEQNKPLIKYLQQQVKLGNIDVQVHCFDHYDFPTNLPQLQEDLPKCIEIITRLFGKRPTVLYPPHNLSNSEVEQIAWLNDLKVSNKKISIEQYLRGVRGDVINFHSWAPEREQLEEALIKYTAT